MEYCMKKKILLFNPFLTFPQEGFLITPRKDFWGKVLSFSKGQNFNALWGIRFWVEKSLVKRKKASSSSMSLVSPKGGNRKKVDGKPSHML